MSQFLADHGVTTKAGTPLAQASVKRLLTNRAYLGFTLHHGEYFPGSFEPILLPTLFEAVQTKLTERVHPRHSKVSHDFPFTGLFRCGECGSMITAQWATGKMGGRYHYYRCTKKKGKCSQGYLQEIALAKQVKSELQGVSLPEAWADYMLKKVEEFEHEETHASGTRLGQWREDLKALEAKLDTLVDLYLNKDIERDIYLTKKDALMRLKSSLQAKSSSLRAEQKNWVEPLRQWILDSKQAGFLASSTKYAEMRDFARSFGTNPALKDKTISISFSPPSIFAKTEKLEFISKHHTTAQPSAGFLLSEVEVSICDPTGNRTLI